MKTLRIAGLGALLCLLLCDSASARERSRGKPVALVYSIAGEAALAVPAQSRRPLRLFDRLPAGASLEVRPGSRLKLAFANGLRYELGERSRATLGPADLASRSAGVRPLPRVPSLPRIWPIAPEDLAGPRTSAVRIRAEGIEGLYPRRGATALADATVLRFQPVEGAATYRVGVPRGSAGRFGIPRVQDHVVAREDVDPQTDLLLHSRHCERGTGQCPPHCLHHPPR